jgi:hypothetical protein
MRIAAASLRPASVVEGCGETTPVVATRASSGQALSRFRRMLSTMAEMRKKTAPTPA